MNREYHPATYWEQRLSKELGLSTVGHIGLGYVYNNWLYKARYRALRRGIRALDLKCKGKSLLDVGVGSGGWIPFWQDLGFANLVGLDITSASVAALQKQYPQFKFVKGDICERFSLASIEAFDFVTGLDVLFHITDDTAFSNSISRISDLVKPSGWVIISDSFCGNPWGPIYHEYHRTWDHYLRELHKVDLEPIHFESIFFTMTTTICACDVLYGRLLSQFTARMLRLVSILASRQQTEWINHLIGSFLYIADGVLCRLSGTGPSLKILFARKGQ